MSRVIMKREYHKWEEIPFVQLEDLLLKQPWFTGTVEHPHDKKAWEKNIPCSPYLIVHIKMVVHGTEIKIAVTWDEVYGFNIHLKYPKGNKKYHTPSGACKHFYSNNFKGALKRIREAIEDAVPACELNKVKAEKEAAEEAARKKEIEETAKTFGICLSEDYNGMLYRPSQNYQIAFSKEGEYYRTILRGAFNQEEMQLLVDFLKNSPGVMADRLENGTGE